MKKYKNDKGFSILLVIGSYGGFHFTKGYSSLHLCIGFIALTIFMYDVENALAKTLLETEKQALILPVVVKSVKENTKRPLTNGNNEDSIKAFWKR